MNVLASGLAPGAPQLPTRKPGEAHTPAGQTPQGTAVPAASHRSSKPTASEVKLHPSLLPGHTPFRNQKTPDNKITTNRKSG